MFQSFRHTLVLSRMNRIKLFNIIVIPRSEDIRFWSERDNMSLSQLRQWVRRLSEASLVSDQLLSMAAVNMSISHGLTASRTVSGSHLGTGECSFQFKSFQCKSWNLLQSQNSIELHWTITKDTQNSWGLTAQRPERKVWGIFSSHLDLMSLLSAAGKELS